MVTINFQFNKLIFLARLYFINFHNTTLEDNLIIHDDIYSVDDITGFFISITNT